MGGHTVEERHIDESHLLGGRPTLGALSKSSDKFSIDDFLELFPDEESCLRHLLSVRQANGKQCPSCAQSQTWLYCGESLFRCSNCARNVRPKNNTFYAKSGISLWQWYHAIYLFTQMNRGLSAQMLAAYMGFTSEMAWRLCNHIRVHSGRILPPVQFGGEGVHVEVDETLLRNVRQWSKGAVRQNVFGITDRKRYLTVAVTDRKIRTLLPIILENIRTGSIINTDGFASYDGLRQFGFKHMTVNHSEGFYVSSDGANTLSIDRYWGKLKKFLGRTHCSISTKYLQTYLNEFQTRYYFRNRPKEFYECMLARMPPIGPPS